MTQNTQNHLNANNMSGTPANGEACFSLGMSYYHSHNTRKAKYHLLKAFRLLPHRSDISYSLGKLYYEEGRYAEAIRFLQEALLYDKQNAEIYYLNGVCFYYLEQWNAAVIYLEQCARIFPEAEHALQHLALCYEKLGKFSEAENAIVRALELAPQNSTFINDYRNIVLSRQRVCDWEDWEQNLPRFLQWEQSFLDQKLPTFPPFNGLSLPFDNRELYEIARYETQNWEKKLSSVTSALQHRYPYPAHNRIRVGYVSGNFNGGNSIHAVALMTFGMFQYHDRSRFEVFVYSYTAPDHTPWSQKVIDGCEHFTDVSQLTMAACIEQINSDQIDILVDFQIYTDYPFSLGGENKFMLSLLRPAPIQVVYAGIHTTTGSDAMDYYITDRIECPESIHPHLSEKPAYMPHAFINCIREMPPVKLATTRTEVGLPEDAVVYVTVNSSYKIDPVIFKAWIEILKAVPDSVICFQLSHAEAKINLMKEAMMEEIDPERLIFIPYAPTWEEHMQYFLLGDLFLDTWYSRAHSTAIEALWAGLPMVTVRGDTMASRVPASILHAAGVTDTIVNNLDEYIEMAVDLGNNPSKLKALRERIARARTESPVFDTEFYVRNLEAAYTQMMTMYRAGQPPRSFDVATHPNEMQTVVPSDNLLPLEQESEFCETTTTSLSPPMKTPKGHLFSQSPLWQLQRRYFEEANIGAWQEGDVPHYITSNPYMAETYAKLLLAFFGDRTAIGPQKEPFYIVELGTGSGRFSYHLIKALLRLMPHSQVKSIPFVYVMTDFVEDTLAFWDKHPRFQEFYAQGILDYALFDAEKDSTLYLRKSNKTIGAKEAKEPLVAIANYFFDTIPQELFYFHEDAAYNALVNLKGYKADSARTAKEQLEKLELDYTYGTLSECPYTDELQRQLFTQYQHTLINSHLLFPHMGLNCIERLKELSQQGLFQLTADKGEHRLDEWQQRTPPYVAKHGSFSLTANYHALKEHCNMSGGMALFPKHPASGITVGALLYLNAGANHQETIKAYHECINDFGPDEYFTIKKHVEKHIPELSVTELLAYVRLSAYDSRFFLQCLPRLHKLAEDFTDDERFLILQLIAKVWDGYYPLGEEKDLAYEIGLFLCEIHFFPEAVTFLELSEKIYGPKEHTTFARAVIQDALGNRSLSIELLNELVANFPDFQPAQQLLNEWSKPAL